MSTETYFPELAEASTNKLQYFDDIKRIKNQLTSKERELEKAQNELEFSDRDSQLHKSYVEKKYNAELRKTSTLETLEKKSELEVKKVEDEIKLWKQKLEIHIQREEAKISALTEHIEVIQRKFEDKKRKIEQEENGHISYFQSEIDRITSQTNSTPKIRALEKDIINLYKDLSDKEQLAYGFVSIPPEKPYLAEHREAVIQLKEKLTKAEEDKKKRLKEEIDSYMATTLNYFNAKSNPQQFPVIVSDTKKRQAKVVPK